MSFKERTPATLFLDIGLWTGFAVTAVSDNWTGLHEGAPAKMVPHHTPKPGVVDSVLRCFNRAMSRLSHATYDIPGQRSELVLAIIILKYITYYWLVWACALVPGGFGHHALRH